MKLNTEKTGWESVLGFDYASALLDMFLEETSQNPGFEMNSKGVYDHLNLVLPPKEHGRPAVSRATVINKLNDFVDLKWLTYREKTGKGGIQRVYRLVMTNLEIASDVVEQVTDHLLKTFPTVYETARAKTNPDQE